MAFEEIEKLKERLAKDPSSKLFVPLAEEYRKAGMFDEAIEVLKNGLDLQPSYMSARVSLGKIYLEKDMVEEARVEFEQVTKAIPDNLFAHKKLAEIYRELGDPIRALERYEFVLKLNPLDEDAKINVESLSGAPADEVGENVAKAPMAPEPPDEPVPELPSHERETAPAAPEPILSEPEAITAEPVRAEADPAFMQPQRRDPAPEPTPAPARPTPPEPEPVSIEPQSAPVEPEPVSSELGSAPSDQTPVEMSRTSDEKGSRLEDMLMHEEVKAEAADMNGDFQQFRQTFSSDLREKVGGPEMPKDDTPMYFTGEEPGSPRPEEHETHGEMHPFAQYTADEHGTGNDDLTARGISEETLADIPVIEDGEEIPEVTLSEDELEEIEAGYPEGMEGGFNSVGENEAVPEISLSESDLENAVFPEADGNFYSSNEEVSVVPDKSLKEAFVPSEPVVPAVGQTSLPTADQEMLQALNKAEVYIDSGDFVQAVQYYDMLLEKFPGEKRILQKLEELKTYLKMTGKGQEMVVRKLEILLEGLRKRRNEFFGRA